MDGQQRALRRVRTTQVRLRSHSAVPDSLLTAWHLCDPASRKICDLAAAFGREAPCILDIGFGKGEVLAAMAAANPQWNFIGCELFLPGLVSLARSIESEGLGNLRLAPLDARDLLQWQIADNSLAGVNLLFPDPWPKKRHHKRRLIQPEFCTLLHSRLEPGGTVYLATDWSDYADWMLEHFTAGPGWQRLDEAAGRARTAGRPVSRPISRFERRGLQAGRAVAEFWFEKVGPGSE